MDEYGQRNGKIFILLVPSDKEILQVIAKGEKAVATVKPSLRPSAYDESPIVGTFGQLYPLSSLVFVSIESITRHSSPE